MYDGSHFQEEFNCDNADDIKSARMFVFSIIAGFVLWSVVIWAVFF